MRKTVRTLKLVSIFTDHNIRHEGDFFAIFETGIDVIIEWLYPQLWDAMD